MDLTTQNLQQYITDHRVNVPFIFSDIVSTNEITEETYVNWIFRIVFKIDGGEKIVYLRQSRDFVKSKPEFKLLANRIAFENKMLALVATIVTDVVPEVLYFDKENNVLWLSDIKRGCPLLVTELIAGRPHVETATFFGKTIAAIHGATLGITNDAVRGNPEANQSAIDFHLGMRLKPALKMFPLETQVLLEESKRALHCLVLGDLASKNIFVDGKQIRFLDLERAFVGDGAFDVGFLFAHYLLEVPSNILSESIKTTISFWKAYQDALIQKISTDELKKMESRVAKFTGLSLLYRLHGSGSAPSGKPDVKFWTNKAKQLLNGKITFQNLI